MLAVNAVMSTYLRYLQNEVPKVSARVFIDDRIMWAKGADAHQVLEAAVNASQYFDETCKLRWNADKGATFSLHANDKKNVPQCIQQSWRVRPQIQEPWDSL